MDDGRKNKQTHKGKQKFTNIVKKMIRNVKNNLQHMKKYCTFL